MAQHEARVFIEAQPRYALPTCDLLHLTASTMLGLQCHLEVWKGGVHRDVSKPLSVCLASVPCMQNAVCKVTKQKVLHSLQQPIG